MQAAASAGRPSAASAVRKVKNQQVIEKLEAQRLAADKQAAREVSRWSKRKLARFGFRPGERDKAIAARQGMIFGRSERRQLFAAETVRDLIERERGTKSTAKRARLVAKQTEIMRSATLNQELGTERNWHRKLKRFLQLKLPKRLTSRIAWLARDTQLDPGTEAIDPSSGPAGGSTMWQERKARRVTGEALYAGPWMKDKNRPQLPDAESVMTLENFRSLDADGIHPSVFVVDPATGLEWKVKFQGDAKEKLSSEPVASRLLYAMGYHTAPVYRLSELRMDPRAVIAAYTHKQRLGVRIKENNWLHLPPGKYGLSPYKMRKQIKSVTLTDGTVLEGAAAARFLRVARLKTKRLDRIRYVTVHGIDVALKGDTGGVGIGPFRPDDLQHIDRREMRALSIISATLMMGNDVRLSNVRLDVEEKDGELELRHTLSDTGAHFDTEDPNKYGWEVDLDLGRDQLHNDNNRFTLKSYDRTRLDDARWAARKVAALSEEQIMASFAAGATSWPMVKLYTEKFIARRDDLVRKVGLERELGLLRSNGPDRTMNVSGGMTLKLRDADGKKTKVELGEGGFVVKGGVLIPK